MDKSTLLQLLNYVENNVIFVNHHKIAIDVLMVIIYHKKISA